MSREGRGGAPRVAARFFAVLLLLAVGGVSVGAGKEPTSARGKTWVFAFAADTLGSPPAATRVVGGRWEVTEDSTARTGGAAAPAGDAPAGGTRPRILRQLESDEGIASHWLQFLKPRLADQETSVRFRIRSGEMDPSVGIAFLLDPKGRNGYLVRVSGKSGELIAHYLLSGKRRDLRYERMAPPGAGEWHTLAVRRAGEVIEVRYDGASMMKLRDERFRIGNVGLWTEDDTVADFADLTVRSL